MFLSFHNISSGLRSGLFLSHHKTSSLFFFVRSLHSNLYVLHHCLAARVLSLKYFSSCHLCILEFESTIQNSLL